MVYNFTFCVSPQKIKAWENKIFYGIIIGWTNNLKLKILTIAIPTVMEYVYNPSPEKGGLSNSLPDKGGKGEIKQYFIDLKNCYIYLFWRNKVINHGEKKHDRA